MKTLRRYAAYAIAVTIIALFLTTAALYQLGAWVGGDE